MPLLNNSSLIKGVKRVYKIHRLTFTTILLLDACGTLGKTLDFWDPLFPSLANEWIVLELEKN